MRGGEGQEQEGRKEEEEGGGRKQLFGRDCHEEEKEKERRALNKLRELWGREDQAGKQEEKDGDGKQLGRRRNWQLDEASPVVAGRAEAEVVAVQSDGEFPLHEGVDEDGEDVQEPVLVVLNKLVPTFGKKSNLKFGLIQTPQLH